MKKGTHRFRIFRPVILLIMAGIMLLAFQVPVFASGSYEITSLDSVIYVGQDGKTAVTELANITSPGASPSVDFFIPSGNYTGESKPPIGKEVMQGDVAVNMATCLYQGSEVEYAPSNVIGSNTYTILKDQSGTTASLSPVPQANRGTIYTLTYTRDKAVTRYDDVAELNLVLVNRGEYGGGVSQSNIRIVFPNAINLDDMEVFVHGAQRWDYGPGNENTFFGITAYGIQPGGLLEVRVLMPVSYVQDSSNIVSGLARQAVESQESALGELPTLPEQPIAQDPWFLSAAAFVAWLIAGIVLYAVYRRTQFPRFDGIVSSPPSVLPPVLAYRLLAPMGSDPSALLSVFLNLVRQGLLGLSYVENEKGRKAFSFLPTGKSSVFNMKHEKVLLDWLKEDAGYEGVTDRELKSASLRRPGTYYYATSDVLTQATNDATDAGLLRDTPAVFRYLWVIIALVFAVIAILPVFFGIFEPLVLLIPAAFTLVIRQYARKAPSQKCMEQSAKWRAHAGWLETKADPREASDISIVEDQFLYSVALGTSSSYVQRLDGIRLPQMEESPLLLAFSRDGVFSAKLYKRLLSSFSFAAFFSAALHSNLIRSSRKATYERIKKK